MEKKTINSYYVRAVREKPIYDQTIDVGDFPLIHYEFPVLPLEEAKRIIDKTLCEVGFRFIRFVDGDRNGENEDTIKFSGCSLRN
ncbi:hypothetical protein COU57_05540 [Candidatus Pacearchaeota archaeon CG10_big_fil_rev_8_21_14_0_10_32_14]|nr:MAG: hypothetical protein COU57_05540 [Candidatus Pacearchaeota archaeon CG10_big_fil_rev_8_21_14_0_10_32_14]